MLPIISQVTIPKLLKIRRCYTNRSALGFISRVLETTCSTSRNFFSLGHDALSLILLLLLLEVKWPPEQHNVWLWAVDGVMHPTTALLNSNCPPFILEDTHFIHNYTSIWNNVEKHKQLKRTHFSIHLIGK